MQSQLWDSLNDRVIACDRCPRLRQYCASVAAAKVRRHADENYWGRPVPNFGSSSARLLIVGLAPAAHGANRTGRMFTGDRSGEWLYRALHDAGFANQPTSQTANDGLELIDCAVTAVCHCAPPDNKPTPEEIENCRPWLSETFDVLKPRVIVALGQIAWRSVFLEARLLGTWSGAIPKFSHSAEVELSDSVIVLGSYHPSQQNTFTGRLTRPMLDEIFIRAKRAVTLSH